MPLKDGDSGAPLSLPQRNPGPTSSTTFAEDAAIEVSSASPDVLVLDSANATKTLTTAVGATAPAVGQQVTLFMQTSNGTAYRLPIEDNAAGGHVFLNADGEAATARWSGTGWQLLSLVNATITP